MSNGGKVSFDEKAQKTLETNRETLKEIDRLLGIIEEIKKKKETAFRKLGITPAMEMEDLSLSEFSLAEQKFFDVIQNEFLTELSSKGLDTDFKKTEKIKSTANLTLSRKRLRI